MAASTRGAALALSGVRVTHRPAAWARARSGRPLRSARSRRRAGTAKPCSPAHRLIALRYCKPGLLDGGQGLPHHRGQGRQGLGPAGQAPLPRRPQLLAQLPAQVLRGVQEVPVDGCPARSGAVARSGQRAPTRVARPSIGAADPAGSRLARAYRSAALSTAPAPPRRSAASLAARWATDEPARGSASMRWACAPHRVMVAPRLVSPGS